MNIGIIDADLLTRSKHRFPNLASMKIAGYYREQGHNVKLILDYQQIDNYDKVFISKVFTDTYIDEEILTKDNVEYGGTGFYYDKALPLPNEIEHHMPYYDLYKDWVEQQLVKGESRKNLAYYLDYSIGFTTRGCFRQCSFCVNKNYTRVEKHSDLKEFVDEGKKYICLLDDNILGYKDWRNIFAELNASGKKFQYKQGMDERLLTKEKCLILLNSNYLTPYYFAFDNIEDKEVITRKLTIWNECRKELNIKGDNTKFYVLCGYDRKGIYDEEFWKQDLIDTFERIKILMEQQCLPYIMRHKDHNNSPFKGTYTNLARWCNQYSIFRKTSYREFCQKNQAFVKTKICASMRYLMELEEVYPEIANEYFDIKYDHYKK